MLTAIALPPPFRDLPQAVLGAIVINAVLGFLRVGELRRIARFRREGFAGSLFALIAVLILGVLPGLILAIALSILMVMVHISRPNTSVLGRFAGTPVFVDVEREPAAQTEPGMLIFRPDAQMLFVNYRLVRDRVIEQVRQAEPPPRVVLADLSFSPTLDIESVDTIAALHAELAEQGVEL